MMSWVGDDRGMSDGVFVILVDSGVEKCHIHVSNLFLLNFVDCEPWTPVVWPPKKASHGLSKGTRNGCELTKATTSSP